MSSRLCVSLNIIESGMVMSGSRPALVPWKAGGVTPTIVNTLVLKGERLPERGGIEAEAPLPIPVADHCCRRGGRNRVIAGFQQPSGRRFHAQQSIVGAGDQFRC